MRPLPTVSLLVCLLGLFPGFATRGDDLPKPVPVGAGSYAEFPPAPNDKLADFLHRSLSMDASQAAEPVPTNKWWTNLLFNQYPGNLWAYPLTVNADGQGLEIFAPSEWNEKSSDMVLGAPLRIGGVLDKVISDVEVLADFEGATYPAGWTTTGTAFGDGPAPGALPGQSRLSGYLGKSLASSFHGGDRAIGELHSPDFKIDHKTIHFLIAGGRDASVLHIDLLVGGKIVRTASGDNNEDMKWKSWDVSEFVGQTAQIQIIDNATGGWGHICVDHILQTDEAADPPPFSPGAFSPSGTRAMSWGDWTLDFRLAQSDSQFMDVTIGRGLPFAWLEPTGLSPRIMDIDPAHVWTVKGEGLTLPATTNAVIIESAGKAYGLYAPPNTRFASDGNDLVVTFSGKARYLVVGLLPDKSQGEFFGKYAGAVPRNSQYSWTYDPDKGQVATKWDLTLESLDGTTTDTLQGWLPHHYRTTTNDLKLCDFSYVTPRGKLKCAPGHSFTITYPFNGILPALPAPTPEEAKLPHPFDASRMAGYLDGYAKDHCDKPSTPKEERYGGDTYWGGKDLTCYAQYLIMAHELGDPHEADFHKAISDALSDWFTYTPGEEAHYFARYDRWKAMVGFHPSYGSETFTDNHFHYGYFTFSAALLGMNDPDFLPKYGGMAKLVAKQYANWDRSDKSFPYLRTFDVWAGHSYAGGSSSGNGNNQESSSEAIQSWGGVFLLGSMLGDKDMTAAGAMGYAVETEAIREYWNDYYGWKLGKDAANFSPTYPHSIVAILGDSGGAFGTFFEGHPMFIYGIEWLPISPVLSYLGRDPEFGKYQLDNMLKEQAASSPGFTFSKLGADWGNVVLGYKQTYDPDGTAEQLDQLWADQDPIAKEHGTGGLTYYFTHAHRSLGRLLDDYHTSIPTSGVYYDEGKKTYATVIYNPLVTSQKATIYHGTVPVGQVTAPGRTLARLPFSPSPAAQ